MRATPPERGAARGRVDVRGPRGARRGAPAARRPGERAARARRPDGRVLGARDRAVLGPDPRGARGRHPPARAPPGRRRRARAVRRAAPATCAGTTARCSSTAATRPTVELAGRGLQLVPAAFGWPEVGAMFDPPWQPALIYPPRGVGDLWAPARESSEALGELVGRAPREHPRRARRARPPPPSWRGGWRRALPASPSTSACCAAPGSCARAATAARCSTRAPPPATCSQPQRLPQDLLHDLVGPAADRAEAGVAGGAREVVRVLVPDVGEQPVDTRPAARSSRAGWRAWPSSPRARRRRRRGSGAARGRSAPRRPRRAPPVPATVWRTLCEHPALGEDRDHALERRAHRRRPRRAPSAAAPTGSWP